MTNYDSIPCKVTDLVFSDETYDTWSLDTHGNIQEETKCKLHKILIRKNRHEFQNFFNCLNYSNTNALRVIDDLTPDKVLESPHFVQWIHRYFQSIKKLGVRSIDCIWFAWIINNLPFDETKGVFEWNPIVRYHEILIDDLCPQDIIHTQLKDSNNSSHMATYLWNNYFLFKGWYEWTMQIATTEEMGKAYPYDEVLKCKPFDENTSRFDMFLKDPAD